MWKPYVKNMIGFRKSHENHEINENHDFQKWWNLRKIGHVKTRAIGRGNPPNGHGNPVKTVNAPDAHENHEKHENHETINTFGVWCVQWNGTNHDFA